MSDSLSLPDGHPWPIDDGASDHLLGRAVPAAVLASTKGGVVDLRGLEGRIVLFIFGAIAGPGVAQPDGWTAVAGADAYTLQARSFRDAHAQLRALDIAHVYGLSSQPLSHLVEMARRLHLPFALLSDEDGDFWNALDLPYLEADGQDHLQRISMILEGGRISKVFYPVLPPSVTVDEILSYLLDA